MERESIDELRERLLREDRVLDMIRMRAYEIYQLRGNEPGREAEDWFQAEIEVIRFLIDHESRNQTDDTAVSSSSPEASQQPVEQAPVKKQKKNVASTKTTTPRKKKASADAETDSEKAGEKKKAGRRESAKNATEGSSKPRKTK